jgi:tape measure domain-containing protein|tara:strand:+ start:8624 stop:11044 length:2421 start_codon:yes stop_codon:yes gene_type:complete
MATTIDRYKLIVDTKGATAGVGGFGASLKGLGPLMAAAFSIAAITKFAGAMKTATGEFENYRNSLSLITDSQAELTDTMQKLNNAAVANRAAFGDTVDLYTKLTLATEELGVSQDQVLKVTGNFQKALAISGADAGTSAGAIRQFGQAMASGTVRGDEFNSIVEALGPALIIMARESGITVGELRKMSQAGELTAESFFKMVEGSEAIQASFEATSKTINQLEQEVSDAFKKLLVVFAENSGAADLYRGVLEDLARGMREVAGASTSLEAASFENLVNDEGLGTAIERLKEFNTDTEVAAGLLAKINELQSGEATDIFGIRLAGHNITLKDQLKLLGLTIEQYNAYSSALEEQARQQGLLAESTKLELEQLEEKRKVTEAVLKPYKDLLASTDAMAKANERGKSSLVKATEAQAAAKTALEELTALTGTYAGSFIPDLNEKIAIATTRHEQLTEQVERLGAAVKETATAQGFYDNLIKEAQSSVSEVNFAKEAVERLSVAFAEGKIAPEVYEAAMKRLNSTLGTVTKTSTELTDYLNDNTFAAAERVTDAFNDVSLAGLTGISRELKQIELDELRLMRTAQERIKTQFGDADATKLKDALASIEATTRSTITARQQAATQTQAAIDLEIKSQRTFSSGWKKAFDEYEDNATNAAKRAEQVFSKTTKGMEDMIVNFAKTGKFEFKEFVASLLEDLLRAQIQQSMASIFQLPALGGGTGTVGSQAGGMFGGFFATGGMIPPGRFGVVGENGPELVSGPANVTPNLGSGAVTYNINAVDARSFKELVAADPGFIHAVANKGASASPRRR